MGNKKSRMIEVDNIQYHLSQCQELSKKNCPVYGPLHLVNYNNMEFYLGEAVSNTMPPSTAIHYIVPPNLLVVPQFTLLEDTQPQSLDSLLQIMVGVSELCRTGEVGMGRRRIGFAGKWGIVGQKPMNWGYQEVRHDPQVQGIYLSPQLMLGLSQDKPYPKHNPVKSDMFAFGIMILEVIFHQKLDYVFDYAQFEIKLKPLLQKLNIVKQQFGEAMYSVLLKMLELQENQRIDFDELLELVATVKKPSKLLSSHMTASNNSITHQNPSTSGRSPLRRRPSAMNYQNDCSPFKGGALPERNNRTPERGGRTPERSRMMTQRDNRSPLKRDLRINTRFDKENTMMNTSSNSGYMSNKSPFKPTLLRKQGLSPISKR